MKTKLVNMISALSIVSIVVALIMKLLGFGGFYLQQDFSYTFGITCRLFVNSIVLILQMFLIVGCITHIKPKKLASKIIPFIPFALCMYLVPKEYHLLYSMLSMVVIIGFLRFKLSTIPLFIINIFLISTMQLSIIWLRWDLTKMVSIFPDNISFILINVDQFILLLALYYINTKVGDKYDFMVLFR